MATSNEPYYMMYCTVSHDVQYIVPYHVSYGTVCSVLLNTWYQSLVTKLCLVVYTLSIRERERFYFPFVIVDSNIAAKIHNYIKITIQYYDRLRNNIYSRVDVKGCG